MEFRRLQPLGFVLARLTGSGLSTGQGVGCGDGTGWCYSAYVLQAASMFHTGRPGKTTWSLKSRFAMAPLGAPALGSPYGELEACEPPLRLCMCLPSVHRGLLPPLSLYCEMSTESASEPVGSWRGELIRHPHRGAQSSNTRGDRATGPRTPSATVASDLTGGAGDPPRPRAYARTPQAEGSFTLGRHRTTMKAPEIVCVLGLTRRVKGATDQALRIGLLPRICP